MTREYDIAVIGSGFAGSVMAMIAKRLGHSVVLLDHGKHPRFAIGESSTPLANLLLEDLANRYDLPMIKPLAKWGSWQRTHPEIGCGLKRGFTFYHHQLGQNDLADPDRLNQLLVAASPHDEIADTHWFRADFDTFFAEQAQVLGVDYLDEAALSHVVEEPNGLSFEVTNSGATATCRARFVIDATGPRGLLHRALSGSEIAFPNYPQTQALYSHFVDVARPVTCAHPSEQADPPYPPEDAAVHHVFDGGWVWVLRFNNGITSAGVAATVEASDRLGLEDGEIAWRRLLSALPNLQEQFANARPIEPFRHISQLSFLSGQVCGKNWAKLPSAAGFVDPLLSTGFPLTLLGIERLAQTLERDWPSSSFRSALNRYAERTTEELLATSRLVAALYANMNNFPVFTSLSLLYFAAASYSESARRLGKPHLVKSFLLHDHPVFGPATRRLTERAMQVSPGLESEALTNDILRAVEPIDVAGLTDRSRRNWYPVDAEDLLSCAAKVESTREEAEALLQRCGFFQRA